MTDAKQGVLSVAFAIQTSLWGLEGLKKAAKEDSLFDRIGDPFIKVYFLLCLRKQKRELLTILNTSWKTADPKKFLAAGDMLFKVNEFKLAKLCFDHAIATLKDEKEQETRLRALVGKLECVIVLGRQELENGTTDGERNYTDAKEWYDAICADVYLLRPAVGLELSYRLRRAFADMHANLRDFRERNRRQSGITQSS